MGARCFKLHVYWKEKLQYKFFLFYLEKEGKGQLCYKIGKIPLVSTRLVETSEIMP